MTEKEKIIILIHQLKDESERYLSYLKCQLVCNNFDVLLRKEYDTRIVVFQELLGMLESGQSLDNFID